MRGLRTIPVLYNIGEKIMKHCPNAIWLQYVNPMCMNMIGINKLIPDIKSVGVFSSGLSIAGLDVLWQRFALGCLIIVAVGIDQWIRKVSN